MLDSITYLCPVRSGLVLQLPLGPTKIPCGFPGAAEDWLEDELDLNERLVKSPPSTFLFRVEGESMKGVGINDGDLLVVDRAIRPKHGRVVVAMVCGDMTVNPRAVRKRFSVVAERTVRELNGVSCIPLEEVPPHPQNIIVSRGFKTRVKNECEMIEAVSFYANRAAEKARQKKVFAFRVHVFIRTDPYGDKQMSYSASRAVILNEARNDAGTIIAASLQALKSIYKPQYAYQKAGIMLTGLLYEDERQTSFFGGGQGEKITALMKTMDKINKTHGRETIRPAVAGTNKTWFMARNLLSPRYTTKWNELRKVRC